MPDSPAFYSKIAPWTRQGKQWMLFISALARRSALSHTMFSCPGQDVTAPTAGQPGGQKRQSAVRAQRCGRWPGSAWSWGITGAVLAPGPMSSPRTWRQQRGAPPAGLWVVPNWEDQPAHRGQGCCPEGLRQAGQEPTRRGVELCAAREEAALAMTDWGLAQTLPGPWQAAAEHITQQISGCLNRTVACGWGEHPPPLSTQQTSSWLVCAVVGPISAPHMEDMAKLEQVQQAASRMVRGRSTCLAGEAEGTGLVQPGEGKTVRRPTAASQHPPGSFQAFHSMRQQVGAKKRGLRFFAVGAAEHRKRLPSLHPWRFSRPHWRNMVQSNTVWLHSSRVGWRAPSISCNRNDPVTQNVRTAAGSWTAAAPATQIEEAVPYWRAAMPSFQPLQEAHKHFCLFV